MRKSITAVLTATLAMVLVVGLLAGCSSSGTNGEAREKEPTQTDQSNQSGQEQQETGQHPAVGDKQLDIKWSGWLARGKSADGNKVQLMIEKKFNVKLINPTFDNSNGEQISLVLASGELPDIAWLPGANVYQMYDDQLTRTIPREMIETYAPHYAAMLSGSPVGWKINRLPGNDKELVALTGSVDWYKNLFWLQVYRLDWLEKVGIAPKGEVVQLGTEGDLAKTFFTAEAFTIEEEERIFDAFVNDDPDGNGKQDTFALTRNTSGDWSYQTYAGAFGFAWGQNLEENGNVVEYNISQKYKEFLKKQVEWYKKGYIDPDFPTLNHLKSWERYGAGLYGVAIAGSESAGLLPFTYNRPPNVLFDKDPNAKFLYTPPPIGANGEQGSGGLVNIKGDTFSDNVVIRKDVSDEKLIRILQIMDYISFDEEAYIYTNFGEVDQDFTWEGEPNQSSVQFKWSEPERNELGIGLYNFVIRPENTTPYWVPQSQNKIFALYAAKPDIVAEKVLRPYKIDRFNETKYNELKSKYGAQLDSIRDEFFFGAVTGEFDIDERWDAYVADWLASGGSELLAELEKAPKTADLSN